MNDTTSTECGELSCPRFRFRRENITRVQIGRYTT
jgi:hypothetical protein